MRTISITIPLALLLAARRTAGDAPGTGDDASCTADDAATREPEAA